MLYLILLLPLAMAALSLIRNDRARTVILAAGQALLLALLIAACTMGDTATPVWHMTADLTFSLRLDGLGRFFCLLTAVCWLLTIPYAAVYMTHEGHHPRFYVFLMLTEAAVLTSMGGILGVATGIGLAEMMSHIMGTPVAISVPACIIAVAFSMVIGVVFGLVPAMKASKLNPIEALRRE